MGREGELLRGRRGDSTVILDIARQHLVRKHLDFKGPKLLAANMRRI
jgi:hypothetical protein